jgi:hypothetical protein
MLFSSCEHFSTREPEQPQSGGSNYRTPDSPSIVISNLQSAFISQNNVNYLRCFQDINLEGEFDFIPSQEVQVTNPGFFTNWNIKSEEIYLINVFNALEPNTFPDIYFTNIQQTINPQTAQMEADYTITIKHNKEGIETDYAGSLQIQFVTNNNDYWYISKLQDFSSSSSTINSTWSRLRFNFGR